MGKERSNKKKKEKITYIDDGSSLADLSGVSRDIGFGSIPGKKKDQKSAPHAQKKEKSMPTPRPVRQRSSFRAQWETYTQSVRMMFFPMLVVIGILCVAFLLLYLLMR